MKILLLFQMKDGQTGSAIKYAFKKLGHTVESVDAKLKPHDSYEACCKIFPDIVLCSRTYDLIDEIQRIKRDFKNTVVCMWNTDAREDIHNWTFLFPLIKLVDIHFTVDINLIDNWKSINPKTFWLPQGLQSEIYMKTNVAKLTTDDLDKYACDVSFCGDRKGKYHKFRDRFLVPVEKMTIVFRHWTGVYNEEHNKMVYLSDINLGCSGFKDIGTCVSARDYKILGAGGFLLTDSGGGLEDIFPCDGPDRILDHYNSPENLVEKIGYWLPRKEERKAIAERGFRWVHKNATYIDRIKLMLYYIEEY